MLVALVLGVLAYLLAQSQSQDREDVRKRFNDVASVSASVTNGIFQASLAGSQQQAAARLGSRAVSSVTLERLAAAGQSAYAAVLDSRGTPLAQTSTAPAKFGPATQTALKTGEARLSDVMELNGKDVVEWGIPYPSETGPRVYVVGIKAESFADFLSKSLGDLPTDFKGTETVMIDGTGVVLGGVDLSAKLGEKLPDQDLLSAIARSDHGTYGGGRYFASGPIDGSPFKIVLDTSEDTLYDSIPSSRKTLPWVIFAAFALAALMGLILLQRALASAAELSRRELNERHAVEINDNIIQGLALAKYQLQLGEDEASKTQLADTLREAQRLVSGLLGDAEVQAGQLRREVAAETGGPEPPAEEPPA